MAQVCLVVFWKSLDPVSAESADQQQVVIEQVTSTPLRPGAPATSLARTKSNLVGEGLQPQPVPNLVP